MKEPGLDRGIIQIVIDRTQQFQFKAEYLIGTPLVADYLGARLEQFDAATGYAEIR